VVASRADTWPVSFDGFGSAFIGPRGPGPDASASEQAAAAIAQLLFPAVLFCLVAFAGLGHHEAAAWLLAALLSVAGYVIARLMSGRLGFASRRRSWEPSGTSPARWLESSSAA
jgi:hypothetical protein